MSNWPFHSLFIEFILSTDVCKLISEHYLWERCILRHCRLYVFYYCYQDFLHKIHQNIIVYICSFVSSVNCRSGNYNKFWNNREFFYSFFLVDGAINETYITVYNANRQNGPSGEIDDINGYGFLPDPTEPGQLLVQLERGLPTPQKCKFLTWLQIELH